MKTRQEDIDQDKKYNEIIRFTNFKMKEWYERSNAAKKYVGNFFSSGAQRDRELIAAGINSLRAYKKYLLTWGLKLETKKNCHNCNKCKNCDIRFILKDEQDIEYAHVLRNCTIIPNEENILALRECTSHPTKKIKVNSITTDQSIAHEQLKANKLDSSISDNLLPKPLRVISLYDGIAGAEAAQRQVHTERNPNDSLYKTVLVSEIDKNARRVRKANYPEPCLINKDINTLSKKQIPQADVLVTGFPCQPFSLLGNKEGFKDKENGDYFFKAIEVLKICGATVAIFENVPTIQDYETTIISALEAIGYKCVTELMDSSIHVPQNRFRWYCVAVRIDSPFSKKVMNKIGNMTFKFPSNSKPKDKVRISYDALELFNKDNPKYAASHYITEILCNHYEQVHKDVERYKGQTKFFYVGKTSDPKNSHASSTTEYEIYSTVLPEGRSIAGAYKKQKNKEFPTITNDINYLTCVYKFFGIFRPIDTLVTQNPIVGPVMRYLSPLELGTMQGFPANYILPDLPPTTYTKFFANTFTVPVLRAILLAVAQQIFNITDAIIVKLEKEVPERDIIKKWDNNTYVKFIDAFRAEVKGFVPKNCSIEEASKERQLENYEPILLEYQKDKKPSAFKRYSGVNRLWNEIIAEQTSNAEKTPPQTNTVNTTPANNTKKTFTPFIFWPRSPETKNTDHQDVISTEADSTVTTITSIPNS